MEILFIFIIKRIISDQNCQNIKSGPLTPISKPPLDLKNNQSYSFDKKSFEEQPKC